MHRRGFLGTLLASVGALAIDPSTLLWRPADAALALPDVAPGALLTLNQITVEILRRVAKGLDLRAPLPLMLDARIGHAVSPNPSHILNHQWGVEFHAPVTVPSAGLDAQRYLDPIAAQFIQRLQGVRACGELPVAIPGAYTARVSDPRTGLSVRGVQTYQIGTDTERIRFDVLVAT